MRVVQILKNYQAFTSEKDKFSECQKYLEKHLRDALCSLNSAGKPLSLFLGDTTCLVNIQEELRMFLANLEVYGSLSETDTFITDYMTQCRFLTID